MTISLQELERLEAAATIPGSDGYLVSRSGDVYSTSNWRGYGIRRLSQFLNRHGYQCVRIKVDGGYRKKTVHRLVALTFLGPPPDGRNEVRHLDGTRTNNALDNLAWGSAKENAADRDLHGRTCRGDKNWTRTPEARAIMSQRSRAWHATHRVVGEDTSAAKLTTSDVLSIRRRRASGEKIRTIAVDFGVHESLVSAIALRKCWKHVA